MEIEIYESSSPAGARLWAVVAGTDQRARCSWPCGDVERVIREAPAEIALGTVYAGASGYRGRLVRTVHVSAVCTVEAMAALTGS